MEVQWLRFCATNAGVPDLISGQGTRSHVLQLKMVHATVKIEDLAIAKTW